MCGELFNGWNPIVHATTLASFSMFVMKNEYLQPGDIGYIPENGYGSDNASMMALKYIQWLEKQEAGLRLQYALRGGEYQICTNGRNYMADAYNKDTNEVYEVIFSFFPEKNNIILRFMVVFGTVAPSVNQFGIKSV